MKTIYFVRHGESTGNAAQLVQSTETPLSDEGLEQARVVAARISTLAKAEVIISSTWMRARQTADAIHAETGLPIEYSPHMGERARPSKDVGKSMQDPDVVAFNEAFMAHMHEPNWKFSDEESFEELKTRAMKALQELEARTEKHIVVVTHGIFLRVLVGALFFSERFSGVEFRDLYRTLLMSNTGITVARHDPSDSFSPWRLLTWNDHAHLD